MNEVGPGPAGGGGQPAPGTGEEPAYDRRVHGESPLHPSLEPIAFLLGRWEGETLGLWSPDGPIAFRDEIEFDHVGKHFLTFRQQAWRQDGVASHGESGYVVVEEGGTISWTIAEPTGVVEVHTGAVEGTRLEVRCAAIGRGPDAINVTAVERSLSVEGDELRYRIRVGMNGEAAAEHIEGRLRRIAPG
jgi:hypothetical protein